MAQLPGDRFLIQQVGGDVILFGRHDGEEIVKFDPTDREAVVAALATIHTSTVLTEDEKAFAHFWSGYFYAIAHAKRRT